MITRRPFLGLILFGATTALTARAANAQDNKLPVVASFSIIADLVSEVGGERIALTTLAKAGSDAHVYAATPADASKIAEARVIFANGLRFESWMNRLVQSSASKARLVEVSKGIRPLAEARNTGGHSHSHSASHAHGGVDPHAWQDIGNVKLYISNIRDALVEADSTGRSFYEKNTADYLDRLEALDNELKAVIARIPLDRRKVISSHDAFGYFSRAYGLTFVSPQGVSTEAEASARDVAKIIQQIRREKIAAVFIENISDQRLIQQIAKESGAKIGGTLYSDSLSAADGPAPTYIQMMRHNIRAISEVLVPKV